MGSTHFILGRPGDGIFPIGRYTVEYLLMKMIEDLKSMVEDAQDIEDKIEEDERDRERTNNDLAGL